MSTVPAQLVGRTAELERLAAALAELIGFRSQRRRRASLPEEIKEAHVEPANRVVHLPELIAGVGLLTRGVMPTTLQIDACD